MFLSIKVHNVSNLPTHQPLPGELTLAQLLLLTLTFCVQTSRCLESWRWPSCRCWRWLSVYRPAAAWRADAGPAAAADADFLCTDQPLPGELTLAQLLLLTLTFCVQTSRCLESWRWPSCCCWRWLSVYRPAAAWRADAGPAAAAGADFLCTDQPLPGELTLAQLLLLTLTFCVQTSRCLESWRWPSCCCWRWLSVYRPAAAWRADAGPAVAADADFLCTDQPLPGELTLAQLLLLTLTFCVQTSRCLEPSCRCWRWLSVYRPAAAWRADAGPAAAADADFLCTDQPLPGAQLPLLTLTFCVQTSRCLESWRWPSCRCWRWLSVYRPAAAWRADAGPAAAADADFLCTDQPLPGELTLAQLPLLTLTFCVQTSRCLESWRWPSCCWCYTSAACLKAPSPSRSPWSCGRGRRRTEVGAATSKTTRKHGHQTYSFVYFMVPWHLW